MNRQVRALVKELILSKKKEIKVAKKQEWNSILKNEENLKVNGIKITVAENEVHLQWESKKLKQKVKKCIKNALNSKENQRFYELLIKEAEKLEIDHLLVMNSDESFEFLIGPKKTIHLTTNFDNYKVHISEETSRRTIEGEIYRKEDKWVFSTKYTLDKKLLENP